MDKKHFFINFNVLSVAGTCLRSESGTPKKTKNINEMQMK